MIEAETPTAAEKAKTTYWVEGWSADDQRWVRLINRNYARMADACDNANESAANDGAPYRVIEITVSVVETFMS